MVELTFNEQVWLVYDDLVDSGNPSWVAQRLEARCALREIALKAVDIKEVDYLASRRRPQ